MGISSINPEGRFQFTSGKRRARVSRSKTTRRARGIPDVHAQRKRIYEALFSTPRSNRRVASLTEALRTFSPDDEGSEQAAVGLLTKWNKGVPAPFNLDELAMLRSLFVAPPMMGARRMAPVQPDPALAMQALRFWNKLVAGDKPAVQALWDLLHKYDTDASAANKRALVDHLDRMVPGVTWTDSHLSSLVSVAVHEVDFQSLAWFEASGDLW
jgi:hypothetical protein